MNVYMVRHAKAGSRSIWDGDDWLRPLSSAGHAQARGLLAQLHAARFTRIIASPSVRCMETVVPLSAAHGVMIEPNGALGEGAPIDGAVQLVKECSDRGAVLCSHGDIIPMLLDHLRGEGIDLGDTPRCEKGSTWVLACKDGAVVAASYVAPPTILR